MTCWFLGNRLKKRPARIAIDKETGRETYVQPEHELYFIPIAGWSVVLLVIALILFAIEFTG